MGVSAFFDTVGFAGCAASVTIGIEPPLPFAIFSVASGCGTSMAASGAGAGLAVRFLPADASGATAAATEGTLTAFFVTGLTGSAASVAGSSSPGASGATLPCSGVSTSGSVPRFSPVSVPSSIKPSATPVCSSCSATVAAAFFAFARLGRASFLGRARRRFTGGGGAGGENGSRYAFSSSVVCSLPSISSKKSLSSSSLYTGMSGVMRISCKTP